MTLSIPPEIKRKCKIAHQKDKDRRDRRAYFEWENGPYNMARAETALWIAVITQAMMDALTRPRNAEQDYNKYEALCWLTGNSQDFITVCHYAGLEPSCVRRSAKSALTKRIKWRAKAGKGKRYHERREYRRRIKEHTQEIHITEVQVMEVSA